MNSFLPERADTGAAADARHARPGKELIAKQPLPTRKLPKRPDLGQLKRQAKELLDALLAGEESAVAEVNRFYHSADAAKFALHDAQLVLARVLIRAGDK